MGFEDPPRIPVPSNPPASEVSTSRKVEVRNIPLAVEEDDLVSYFEAKFGRNCLSVCKLFRHSDSGVPRGMGSILFADCKVEKEAVQMSENGLLELYERKLSLKVIVQGSSIVRGADNKLSLLNSVLYLGCLKAEDKMATFSHFQGPLELEVDTRLGTVSLYFTSRRRGTQYKMEFRGLGNLRPRFLSNVYFQGQSSKGFLLQIRDSPPYLFSRRIAADVTGDFYAEMVNQALLTTPSSNGSNRSTESSAWIRTTDFTPERLIGQSFAYMVEAKALEDWQEKWLLDALGLTVTDGRTFLLERGAPYAVRQEVVPILRSEKFQKFTIPFDLIFRINHLIQHGKLNCTTFDEECAKLVISSSEGHVRMALQSISQLRPHHKMFDCKRLLKSHFGEAAAKFPIPPAAPSAGAGRAWIYRLLVTPTKAYCLGPEVEQSNRIVRLHAAHSDNFIRVNFVDEHLGPLTSSALISAANTTYTPMYSRIRRVLRDGFSIGNRQYEFLAFSTSQLRQGQLWMFAKALVDGKSPLTAESLRAEMGDFSQIRNVAKYAARMGQCFSSSRKTLTVLPLQVKTIKDIMVTTQNVRYCFSDGIGKISVDFARKVAATLGCRHGKVPSAYQIRYGGYKGVVAVDPSASNSFKLYLRPSMRKFDSAHLGLEVLEWTRFLPCYLNRQAISLLSTLGVEDSVFIDLQDQMVVKWCQAVNDVSLAKELLLETEANSIALLMLNSGFTFETEPLLRKLMLSYMHAQFRDIRNRARIFVPEGRQLMGCLDETGILQYGQAFVKISSSFDGKKADNVGSASVIQQKIIVLKSPCLHPGDVRVLQCIDVPELQHMVDCIVFPQRGPRPHPNECSGSDLDGDMYLVSWYQPLLPPTTDPPMSYESPPAADLGRRVTIEDIQNFFVDYMANDNLGIISNAHVVHCDKELDKARNPKCLELAHLASMAVDFPKTGVPAIIPWYLQPREYPDFMEKEHKTTYVSNGVLGKLYRCSNILPETAAGNYLASMVLNKESETPSFCDPDLVVKGHEQFLQNALGLKRRYDAKLMQLMNHYGIRDEAEIFGGHIISLFELYKRREMDVVPKILLAFERLQNEARSWFRDFEQWKDVQDGLFAWASAWYVATYHRDFYGTRGLQFSEVTSLELYLLSFPWVLSDLLCDMKKAKGLPGLVPPKSSSDLFKSPDPVPPPSNPPTNGDSTGADPGILTTNTTHTAIDGLESSPEPDESSLLPSTTKTKRRKPREPEILPASFHEANCDFAPKRQCLGDSNDEENEVEID